MGHVQRHCRRKTSQSGNGQGPGGPPTPGARALTAFRKVVATPTSPLLWVTLSLKGRNIPAIVDTGAQFSCDRSDVVEYLYLTGEACSFLPCHVSCLLADGTVGQVSNVVKLHVGVLSFSWNHEFKILNDGPFPAILGLDFLQRTQMTLDLPSRSFGFAFAPDSVGSFLTEVGISGDEPFLLELCMKAVELTTIAQVQTKDLCARR